MDDLNKEFEKPLECSRTEDKNPVETPNEVSRQAIQDAVNGVGMQTVNSIEELMKVMEE